MERPLNIEGHVLWHQSELDFLHEIKPYLHNIRYKVSDNIAIKVIKTRNSRIVQLSDRLLLWGIVEFVIKMVNCTVNCFLSFFSFAGSPFLLTKHIKLRSRFLLLCGLEMELNCSPTKDRCSYLHNWNAIIWNDPFVLRFNTLNLVCCFFFDVMCHRVLGYFAYPNEGGICYIIVCALNTKVVYMYTCLNIL